MYRRKNRGLMKHIDFILLDLFCIQMCFALAYITRHGWGSNPYQKTNYQSMALVLILFEFVYAFFVEGYKDILKRGYYVELVSVLKQVCIMELLMSFYLFVVKDAGEFSRTVLLLLGIYQAAASWLVRSFWKIHLKNHRSEEGNCSLLLITTTEMAEGVLKKIEMNNFQTYRMAGIVFMDQKEEQNKKEYEGVEVVNKENMAEWTCKNWVDEVFIVLPKTVSLSTEYMKNFMDMGIVVHYSIIQDDIIQNENQTAERICGYIVLTTSIRIVSAKEYIMKRVLDIIGGMIGTIITMILTLILGILIKKASPGPVFFQQERVGMNGKKFQMYKFRTMHLDAEERKDSLRIHNEVSDGMMFKMENDPRIIGSRIDEKTGKYIPGIGNWIRKLSLDEFPQFFNVLRGDMSLVGTRPPTVDEYEKYKMHHKARLSVKPGITGLWQISGRNEIKDFEEVVKLDTDYIYNWSIPNDLKILFKTIRVVISRKGSM